jgi:hypothetical protein
MVIFVFENHENLMKLRKKLKFSKTFGENCQSRSRIFFTSWSWSPEPRKTRPAPQHWFLSFNSVAKADADI